MERCHTVATQQNTGLKEAIIGLTANASKPIMGHCSNIKEKLADRVIIIDHSSRLLDGFPNDEYLSATAIT